MRTVNDVISGLVKPVCRRLRTPEYKYQKEGERFALAVPSMQNHMSNEGWQIMQGLQSGGYKICGSSSSGVSISSTNLSDLIQHRPSVVVLQDKREWGDPTNRLNYPVEKFQNLECLKSDPSVFKVTILKDSHQRPSFHIQSAEEINCHAWIIYYHPKIVNHLAPYTRSPHLIRTYHSIDPEQIPGYNKYRNHCLLSGCLGNAYPFRTRIVKMGLPDVDVLRHPGYHNRGTNTNEFLRTLSRYKVAICTSSVYGYALRKIIEATACGCVVVTDLPVEDSLPDIDENLIRIQPNISAATLQKLLHSLCVSYDAEKQQHLACVTKNVYDYKVCGNKLVNDIEELRYHYANAI